MHEEVATIHDTNDHWQTRPLCTQPKGGSIAFPKIQLTMDRAVSYYHLTRISKTSL